MPYINIKTNTTITKEKSIGLKEKLGKAIEIIPGKSESYLMLGFEDNLKMYFKGQEGAIAFVEVMLLGKASDASYDKLTAAITQIINQELQVSLDKVYIKYEEVVHWGHNGFNF